MTDHGPLPNWVAGPDSHREPFDEDLVSRAVFAATERVGRPDPFLSRELTDSVLHFLAADGTADEIAVRDLHDTIVKVVRELGRAALARVLAYASENNAPAGDSIAAETSPDLQAAQRDGLLHFFDSDDPTRLAGVALRAQMVGKRAGFEPIAAAAARASRFVAVDSPDHVPSSAGAAGRWATELCRNAEAGGLMVLVNLNCNDPPTAVASATGERLFGPPNAADRTRRRDVTEALLETLVGSRVPNIPVCWHLSEADADPSRLKRVAAFAAAGAPLRFAVDRPRHPVHLGTGLDRENPAVLDCIGVGLPRLLQIVRDSGNSS
jgi:hypothetical protein